MEFSLNNHGWGEETEWKEQVSEKVAYIAEGPLASADLADVGLFTRVGSLVNL